MNPSTTSSLSMLPVLVTSTVYCTGALSRSPARASCGKDRFVALVLASRPCTASSGTGAALVGAAVIL